MDSELDEKLKEALDQIDPEHRKAVQILMSKTHDEMEDAMSEEEMSQHMLIFGLRMWATAYDIGVNDTKEDMLKYIRKIGLDTASTIKEVIDKYNCG